MSIEIPEKYRSARAAVPFHGVSLGFDSVDLTPPILLDKNPLNATERDEFLEWIASENPKMDSDFWDQLCGAYDE